jgi:hypothetical protein
MEEKKMRMRNISNTTALIECHKYHTCMQRHDTLQTPSQQYRSNSSVFLQGKTVKWESINEAK